MPLLRQPVRVRWWIFAFLFAFATLSYLQRTSFSIVSTEMIADLHLDLKQFGWLTTMFAAAYAVSQVPSAALGQWLGARVTYVVVGIISVTAMLISSAAPYVAGGLVLFALLLLSQMLLGASQGPVFPMFAAVVQQWFPQKRWALANGMQSAGMDLGGLVAPPLLVYLTQSFGWKGALLWLALPATLLTVWWGWYGRNRPEEHPSVSAEEIAELAGTDRAAAPPLTMARLLRIATNRDVLLLSLSYMGMNIAFYFLMNWSYIYLVQVRHLQGLESGFAGAIPWFGAAIGAAVGGVVSDRLVTRYGARWGYRIVPMITLPAAGLMLLVTTQVATPYSAVAALTAAFCLVECTEGAFWAATMCVAQADTAAATGVLNTGGNLAGIFTGIVVGHLAAAGAWNGAFQLAMLLAFAGGGLWLLVDADRRVEIPVPSPAPDTGSAA
jgi:ACS family glucarate transporter-like MFS transporter